MKKQKKNFSAALKRKNRSHKASVRQKARLLQGGPSVSARKHKEKNGNAEKKGKPSRSAARSGTGKNAAERIERGLRFSGSVYSLPFKGGQRFIRPESVRLGFDVRAKGFSEDGDKVAAVLTRVPHGNGEGEAEIVAVFGKSGTLQADYEAILSLSGIPRVFPSEIEEEAEKEASAPLTADGRLDLRNTLLMTIDGASAKDLDDAVSLQKTENGWLLGVHIADVSHYVKEGTSLDREAMERGTSVYFVDQVVPMLPPSLSNGACSLDAGSDKYALSAFLSLDKKGMLLETHIEKSIVRSAVRGVYEEVNALFKNGKRSRYYKKYENVYPMLREMKKLYSLRADYAVSRGCVALESTECEILCDGQGYPTDIVAKERGEAEKLIEQFMLLANEAVARYLTERKCPCVYRIHEPPDEEKADAFILLCHHYGINASSLRHPFAGTDVYADILLQAREKGVCDIISDAMLRSFMKARYSAVRSPHFGLALDHYCHFTSPIRRYPDLTVHRILSTLLAHGAGEARKYAAFAKESAARSSDCELRALNAERSILDLYKTVYLKAHEGEEYEGRIVSVHPFGFFVALDNTCEGMVPVSSLPGFFTYNEELFTLGSKKRSFTLGDRVKIRIVYADIARHRTEFHLSEEEED